MDYMQGNFSPIQVTASVSRESGGPFGLISQRSQVSDTFVLTVSEGTGDGFFTPDIQLQGETNESRNRFFVLGGEASTNWPKSISTGSPNGPATTNPQFSCTPTNRECNVPFQIGVPLTFAVSLEATALIEVNPSSPNPEPVTITTSARFNGILLFHDASGKPLKVQYRLDRVPRN